MVKKKPLTAAERQRRCREKRKNDQEKVAEVRRKDLERYHARKKLVKDMTTREHRIIKRKWQRHNKKRREKREMLQSTVMNTPDPSPVLESVRELTPALSSGSCSSRGRNKVKRDRSKVYRTNIKLQEQVKGLEKKLRKYKKRLQRKSSKIESNNQKENKKYAILSNAIKERYKSTKRLKDKRLLKSLLQTNAAKKSRMQYQLIQDTLGVQRTLKYKSVLPKKSGLVQKIEEFFSRDDVTRATAGKKETVTYKKVKVQKRFLLDSMKNLYKVFIKENGGLKCHYSYFAKHRPFFVKPPTVDGRDTCLCKLHANMAHIGHALYKHKVISQKDLHAIVEAVVCDVNSVSCMKGICSDCLQMVYNKTNETTIVELRQWVRKTETIEKAGKTVKIAKNVPVIEKLTIDELIQKFESLIKSFKIHIYNVKHQYKAYRQCIDGLTENEVALHIDFSENYACKYHAEVQSHHWGGSRNQVTLHTVVLYHNQSKQTSKQVISYCTVSSNKNHGPSAIWAHLHPILAEIRMNFPAVSTVHFFSDGPATQYKQKINFFLMANRFFVEYGFCKMSWNFFESAHGKGAADGVGGTLKREADAIVARGKDIADVSQFYSALKDLTKIKLFIVTDEDIENVAATIPSTLLPLKGTMQVHQMFSITCGTLSHRELSCFCKQFCCCHNPKTYQPLPEIQLNSEYIAMDQLPVSETEEIDKPLSDITNIMTIPRNRFYDTVYGPDTSSDEDDQPLITLRPTAVTNPAAIANTSHGVLKPDDLHPTKIKAGVNVLVKFCSEKNLKYTYAGVAKSTVDEEGDVRVMFFKTVDDSGKLFKLVETDVHDVPFEDLIKILPTPKIVKRGRRELFKFNEPLEVFEK